VAWFFAKVRLPLALSEQKGLKIKGILLFLHHSPVKNSLSLCTLKKDRYMNPLKIGISIGDINGIGLEVILKTFANELLLNQVTPVIYGSAKVVSYHKNIADVDIHMNTCTSGERAQTSRLNVVNCWEENVNITLGKPTAEGGQYAYRSLEVAIHDLKKGWVDALVTAPINKEAMKMANFQYPGHTEYLTHTFDTQESLMFMVSENLRVGLVTNHVPLGEVTSRIDKSLIVKKIKLMNESLRMDYGIERPTIAVLGLNPHAGDGGAIGEEEEQLIRPAIVECKKKGILAMGPFAADGLFGSQQYAKFDGILAMYHDQGLIPFKALSFGKGVNFTAGLPVVRTSPDHGTAYDLAGKNEADPSSFRQAVYAAMDVVRNRRDQDEIRQNAMVKKQKPKDVEREDELPEGSE
jgi:4-hydroxythreonine-4-phosphate dehydrogenase